MRYTKSIWQKLPMARLEKDGHFVDSYDGGKIPTSHANPKIQPVYGVSPASRIVMSASNMRRTPEGDRVINGLCSVYHY